MDQANRNAKFTQEEDIFQRKTIGEGIIKLIDSPDKSHNGALTISIDAPWGIGKTTFISMLENGIKENSSTDWCTVYYDAWENDMSDDPFTSILFHICGQLPHNLGTAVKGFIKEILLSASQFLDFIPNTTTKVIGAGLGLAGKMVEHTGYDDICKAYSASEEHKKSLHDNLSEVAKKCKKLIVFVDELDRCKPTFAVHLLETIKHYFDIDNMIFIFGIDGSQLCETIKHYYGPGFDSSAYLTRFFEYNITLPQPTIHQMLKFCHSKLPVPANILTYIENIFSYCSITPREINSIISNIRIITNYYLEAPVNKTSFYYGVSSIALLLSIKCKKKQLYTKVIAGEYYKAETDNNIERHIIGLSKLCKCKIKDICESKYNIDGPFTDYDGIVSCMLSFARDDHSINIGLTLQRILNIVEVPYF